MRVIVIGASAGGVEALSYLAAQIPPDINAAILVVLHIPHNATSLMPEILRRAGDLPAMHAATREPLRPGRIYIAPPDRHMMVRDGMVVTTFGPRENGHRPAVDPLFRSAAESCAQKVIGVILTGNLDDGTAGLSAIKQMGGITIVQDPEDALYSGMPQSAIDNVKVDHVLPLEEIVPEILRLLGQSTPQMEAHVEKKAQFDIEVRSIEMDPELIDDDGPPGKPSGFTCPECNGGLWELHEGNLIRYRCRVGHAYSSDSLVSAYGSSVEAALWAAFRSLEENAAFSRRLARRAKQLGQEGAASRFIQQSEKAAHHANTLRGILAAGPVAAAPEHAELVASE
jgi:two-component system chemotaxis response regulator CheB